MRPSRVIVLALLGGPLLSGATCGGQRTDPPEVVEVPVERVVEVPKALTLDCYDESPREQTTQEAVRLATVRKQSLAECTARMRRIRALERPQR